MRYLQYVFYSLLSIQKHRVCVKGHHNKPQTQMILIAWNAPLDSEIPGSATDCKSSSISYCIPSVHFKSSHLMETWILLLDMANLLVRANMFQSSYSRMKNCVHYVLYKMYNHDIFDIIMTDFLLFFTPCLFISIIKFKDNRYTELNCI